MKITQIKKLCADAHMCMIYETDGNRQWIGTQEAIYPVDELQIGKGSIPTLFDMPDAGGKMEIGVDEIWKSELVPGDCEIEVEMDRWAELHCGSPMYHLDEKIYPMMHDGGILFVREELGKPAIRKSDYMVFKLTRNRFGHPLVMIGNGLEVTGIAKPIPKKAAANILDTLAKWAQMTPEGSPVAEAANGGGKNVREC